MMAKDPGNVTTVGVIEHVTMLHVRNKDRNLTHFIFVIDAFVQRFCQTAHLSQKTLYCDMSQSLFIK